MNDDFHIISFITEEKLLNNENNEDYDDIYLLIKNNKLFSKDSYFDIDEYIYNIFKSYKFDWKDIKIQFIKDFPRMPVYINNDIISDYHIFKSLVKKYKQFYYKNINFSINYYKLLVTLCTQSSFFLLFIYGRSFENLFRKIYNNDDLYIIQNNNNESKTLYFDIKKNKINFSAILFLYLKNITDNEILNKIYLELSISFNLYNENYIPNITIIIK